MERVIVTIFLPGEGELDLEVPTDLPVGVLLQELALALGWDARGGLYADPPGRVLSPHETLAQAGIVDGTRLLSQGPGNYSGLPLSFTPLPPHPERESPIQGWRPLELGEPPASPAHPPPSGGFVWKRIDGD